MDNKKFASISKTVNIISNVALLLGFLIVLKIGYDKVSMPGVCPIDGNMTLIRITLVLLAISFILGLVSDYYKKKIKPVEK